MATYPGIPAEVTSKHLLVHDLKVHFFEARPATAAPLIVLLHGFPESAYSWRKVLVPLSIAGYHVVAPDLRGYGETTTGANPSKSVEYDDDLSPFRLFNLVRDIVSFVYALGYDSVAAVVGHDYGSSIAGYCATIRPDLFKSVVLMSAPFTGPPKLTFSGPTPHQVLMSAIGGLKSLDPPRKHYIMYYSSPEANQDMLNAPQGLHTFLREYFHMKSADWDRNDPHPLKPNASSVSTLPHYYIMLQDKTMPQSVQGSFSGPAPDWLSDEELGVYVHLWSQTGFQGGLNHYRCVIDAKWSDDLLVFSGKKIEVPAMFIGGKKDWGVYQYPGAIDLMRHQVCVKMDEQDFVLLDGAGHWAQQEKSGAVVEHLLRFLNKVR